MGNGMTVGRITGACQRAFGFPSSTNRPPQPSQDDDCCELPSNPFKGASSNPFDLYGRVSGFISGLLGANMCVENQNTDAILNPNSKANPNFLIFRKFQISALLGRMYDFLKYLTLVVKADQEATKDAYQVGFAA